MSSSGRVVVPVVIVSLGLLGGGIVGGAVGMLAVFLLRRSGDIARGNRPAKSMGAPGAHRYLAGSLVWNLGLLRHDSYSLRLYSSASMRAMSSKARLLVPLKLRAISSSSR
jgi:hypothetical protein